MVATALPHRLFRATSRATTFFQCPGELAELDCSFVSGGQLLGKSFCLGGHIPQEIKEKSGPVEQVLHIHQRRRHIVILQQSRARFKGTVAMLFQPSDEQFVFRGHLAENLAVMLFARFAGDWLG